MPSVSIITATYNRSDVLRCAITSVRAQTIEDWELIIIGDGCTDDTAEVVASFSDPRILFMNRNTNCGEQSAPNNDGFKLAKGGLIAYLNHDDLWFSDHLETLIRFIKRTGADLVYALPFNIDRNGAPYCGLTNEELRYDPSHFIAASFWLVRRELIEELGGWRPAVETHAHSPSQDFLTRAWQRTKEIRCHPKMTALFLASGGRPNSFKIRDSSQHQRLLDEMSESNYRERLLTVLAMRSAREVYSIRTKGALARLNHLIDKVLVWLRMRPDSIRNFFAGRRRGWWIDHIREFGGLPPLDRNRHK